VTGGEDPAVTAAAELTGTFKAMTAQMARLSRRGKRDRRLIIGLVVSITLDLLVTAGLGWNTVRQNDIQASSHASDIRQCQIANATRIQDIAIWNRLLRLPAGATAAQKALVADLERLVKAKDAPRDCNAAYKR
jgi:hypothetical protein